MHKPATASPGAKNTGVNMVMTTNLVITDIPVSVNAEIWRGMGLSTALMSCVHLAIILAVGVSSNHLQARIVSSYSTEKVQDSPKSATKIRFDQQIVHRPWCSHHGEYVVYKCEGIYSAHGQQNHCILPKVARYQRYYWFEHSAYDAY